jgi:Rieske Fe-S protein
MAEPYFPEQALAILRAAQFDPTARPGLELLSGSLVWDDEAYLEFVPVCRHHGCTAYWEPLVFRSSLIRGQPDEGCRRGWDELQRACPEWPGFRPERRGDALRAELERQLSQDW